MSMFCYQCQEAAKGTGCTIKGVCGKTDEVANIQDLLIYVTKGVSVFSQLAREKGVENDAVNQFVFDALFTTITNANFDYDAIIAKVRNGLKLREEIKNQFVMQVVKFLKIYIILQFGQLILLKNLKEKQKL